MVQVMTRHNLVLNTLIVEHYCMLRTVTLEHIKVLHCELFILVPPDPQTLVKGTALLSLLEHACIEQVEYFLIVDLQEGTGDGYMFLFTEGFSLGEDLSYASECDTVLHTLLYHCLSRSLALNLGFFILVALHGVGLPRACLTIGEDCSMKTFKYLADKASYLKLIKDFFLRVLRVDDLIELEVLAHHLTLVFSRVLTH